MNVYYVNHTGAKFTLLGDGLTYIDPMELHSFEWSYVVTNRLSGMGGVATDFARRPRTFELELRMRGYDRQQFLDQVNSLHDITEADMIAGEPGRLYVDEQYLTCYMAVSGADPSHPRLSNFMTKVVTVLAIEPYWCTPVTVTLYAPQEESGQEPQLWFFKTGVQYVTGYRWDFSVTAGQPEAYSGSPGRNYAVYELPEGITKIGLTAYHYTNKYAGYGFYKGVPGESGTVSTYVYQHDGIESIGPIAVDIPTGSTHLVLQLGNNLNRGVYAVTTGGKKFDLRYNYRYGTGLAGNVLNNSHYAPAPMILTFFGPATNPAVTIDGVTYGADVILTATDRLVIDQLRHKVYTVSETGVETSVFDARNKVDDIFTPCPTGQHTVLYSGDFSASITMIYQRSELRWTA